MSAKYRVGQRLKLLRPGSSSEVCEARIVDMWTPGHKRNSHMYRVELWPSDGAVEVQWMETRDLTYAIGKAVGA